MVDSEDESSTVYVVNRSAGSGRAGRRWDSIATSIPAHAQVVVADSPDAMADAIDRTLTDRTRKLVAVGGDGTFHHLANYVMARELGGAIDLGLIPAGTASDLARTLGLPLPTDAASTRIRQGRARAMDLLAVELGHGPTRYAANVASFGISAAVAADVRAQARRRRHSYFTAAVRQLLKGRPRELSLSRDGHAWISGSIWLVAAANGPCFGGGMRVAPHAQVDDGELDCVVVHGSSTARLLWQLPKVYFGRHLTSPDVSSARARTVEIDPGNDDRWHAELDGEIYEARTVSVRLLPGAIRVIT
jgi:diacylglycerol kinase (ATP)